MKKYLLFIFVSIALGFLAYGECSTIVNRVGDKSVSDMFHGPTVALVEAIVAGDFESANELLQQGADINQIGKYSDITPLIWVGAVTKRDLNKMEYMLKHAASPNIRGENSNEMSAMEIAVSGDSKALLELFLKYGGDATLEATSMSKGGALRRNLLMVAISNWREDYFELLLNHGADVNWNIDGTKGSQTVTDMCLLFRRYDWLLYFLKKGHKGDLYKIGEAVKIDGVSPTREAGRQKLIQYLIDHGVDINQTGTATN